VGSGKVRKVDVRVVAATNRELRAEVNAHRFRMDLYYRLAVITARVPPLRDRLDDLPLLVPDLIARIQREHAVADVALPDDLYLTLRRHSWPGNVRELRNWLENLLILNAPPAVEAPSSTDAAAEAFFAEFASLPLKRARELLLERFDRRYVTLLLERSAHNVAEAARQSNVDRGTLFRLIRRYNLRGV
jgi:DNA-binding NtrC family response regulator